MSVRRGSITLRRQVQLGPGPITLEDLRQFVAGLTAQLDEGAVGDAEIVSMAFSKLLAGTLEGAQVLRMKGAGVILQSDNYVPDLQRMRSGVINLLSKNLYIPGGQFSASDVGRAVFGETFGEGTEIVSVTDSEHAVLNNFPGANAVSVLVYIPDRPLGAGWALKGDGSLEINVGGIFRGELQIQGFSAHADGTIEIGAGDSKMVASPDGSFSWGSAGAKIGITPDGKFFGGGVDYDSSVFRFAQDGDFILRETATTQHSIPLGAIDEDSMSPPAMSPSGGAFDTVVTVAILCSVQGARIYYTDDGSTPDDTDTPYTGPIGLSVTTTLKARAYKLGVPSSVTSRTFTQDGATVSNPEFDPVPGEYTPGGEQTVGISCATPGASIRYTIDGTTPTDSHGTLISPVDGSTPPSGSTLLPIGTTTLKAIAYKGGLANSAEMSGEYVITLGGGSGAPGYGGRGDLP